MKWITRRDIKVDRVACPWLIKRFIDPQAAFLFVEERDLVEQAKKQDAILFDAPKLEGIKLNHRGSRCTFEAIVEDFALVQMNVPAAVLCGCPRATQPANLRERSDQSRAQCLLGGWLGRRRCHDAIRDLLDTVARWRWIEGDL